MFGPANLPAETVAQLEGQIAEILAQPEAAERLGALGLQPMQMDSVTLSAFVASEIEKWKQLAQDANIEPQ